jgi:hypothetical protein
MWGRGTAILVPSINHLGRIVMQCSTMQRIQDEKVIDVSTQHWQSQHYQHKNRGHLHSQCDAMWHSWWMDEFLALNCNSAGIYFTQDTKSQCKILISSHQYFGKTLASGGLFPCSTIFQRNHRDSTLGAPFRALCNSIQSCTQGASIFFLWASSNALSAAMDCGWKFFSRRGALSAASIIGPVITHASRGSPGLYSALVVCIPRSCTHGVCAPRFVFFFCPFVHSGVCIRNLITIIEQRKLLYCITALPHTCHARHSVSLSPYARYDRKHNIRVISAISHRHDVTFDRILVKIKD